MSLFNHDSRILQCFMAFRTQSFTIQFIFELATRGKGSLY